MVYSKRQSLFFAPKNKRLAEKISIVSPYAFRKSITELRKHGLSLEEKRALVLAKNRAGAFSKKKSLSAKERRQMKRISNMRL